MKAHWRTKQLLISSVVCRIGYEQQTNVSCKMSATYCAVYASTCFSSRFIWISGFTLCFFFNWTNNLVFTHCSIKSFFDVISALLGILLACVRAIYHKDNMFWREIFCEVFVPLTARFLSCFWVSGGFSPYYERDLFFLLIFYFHLLLRFRDALWQAQTTWFLW